MIAMLRPEQAEPSLLLPRLIVFVLMCAFGVAASYVESRRYPAPVPAGFTIKP